MSDSVTNKASKLLGKGSVVFDEVTFNKMTATVIAAEKIKKDGVMTSETHEHAVIIWRDGHYSCTCTNFLYSKAMHLSLWEEGVRVKPECKHALAVKLSPVYKTWIRMYLVPTDTGDGYALRAVEGLEIIHVKSLEDKIKDKLLPKVKTTIPRLVRGKIPFEKIFSDE